MAGISKALEFPSEVVFQRVSNSNEVRPILFTGESGGMQDSSTKTMLAGCYLITTVSNCTAGGTDIQVFEAARTTTGLVTGTTSCLVSCTGCCLATDHRLTDAGAH